MYVLREAGSGLLIQKRRHLAPASCAPALHRSGRAAPRGRTWREQRTRVVPSAGSVFDEPLDARAPAAPAPELINEGALWVVAGSPWPAQRSVIPPTGHTVLYLASTGQRPPPSHLPARLKLPHTCARRGAGPASGAPPSPHPALTAPRARPRAHARVGAHAGRGRHGCALGVAGRVDHDAHAGRQPGGHGHVLEAGGRHEQGARAAPAPAAGSPPLTRRGPCTTYAPWQRAAHAGARPQQQPLSRVRGLRPCAERRPARRRRANPQGVLTVFVGNLVTLVPLVLNAFPGTKYGIPFPVLARASFGIKVGAVVVAADFSPVKLGYRTRLRGVHSQQALPRTANSPPHAIRMALQEGGWHLGPLRGRQPFAVRIRQQNTRSLPPGRQHTRALPRPGGLRLVRRMGHCGARWGWGREFSVYSLPERTSQVPFAQKC